MCQEETSFINSKESSLKGAGYSSALVLLAETVINNEDSRLIVQEIARITGKTLGANRCLLYDVDFERHLLIGISEWLDPGIEGVTSIRGIYNIDIFEKGIKFMWENRRWLETTGDDTEFSSEVFNQQMKAESMLCFPFLFRKKGFYCLVLNHFDNHRWEKEDIHFLNAAAYHASFAIQKIGLLNSHKQAEAALAMAEERFSKTFNSSPNPMAVNRFRDCRFLSVNDSFVKIMGYTREELMNNTPSGLNLWVREEERDAINSFLNNDRGISNLEVEFRNKSGTSVVALFSAENITVNGEKCVLSILTDITEHKKMEKEMARLDRLNLMGQMAAAIGHEIRNPMTSIRGFLQILMGKAECTNYHEFFTIMIDELDRANAIITEFLSMAKSKPAQLKLQNLNDILNTLHPLIEADARNSNKNVILEQVDIPELMINGKEIRQLVLNIARNGLEAMPQDGNLTIKTYTDYEDVILEISDQGKGIDDKIIDKIGTPFFTTKEQGTGLGLAICESIAVRNNATISLKSNPGGTSFFVRFKNLYKGGQDTPI